jgi:methylated-DNA-protein-cysteine methyltransferase-like protein
MDRQAKSDHRASFDTQVYRICRQIPEGRARWVGYAMARCPEDVPWHRVINSKGGLSLRPGHEHQRALLEDEGVTFSASGVVDLKRYGWKPS